MVARGPAALVRRLPEARRGKGEEIIDIVLNEIPWDQVVRIEPGFEPEALDALAEAGYDVRPFGARHHYFGGVSLLARTGAGADPRRSGAALLVP